MADVERELSLTRQSRELIVKEQTMVARSEASSHQAPASKAQQLVGALRDSIGKARFHIWFGPITVSERGIIISVKDEVSQEMIEHRFGTTVTQVVRQFFGRMPNIQYVISPDHIPQPLVNDTPTPWRPTERPHPTFGRFTLDSFVVGPSNREAYGALQVIAEHAYPGRPFIILHGDDGVGKTHLVQGFCKCFLEKHADACVQYLTATEFVARCSQSGSRAGREAFLDFQVMNRDVDLFVMDDFHLLPALPHVQEELLSVIQSVLAHDHHVVLVSNAHPMKLEQLSDVFREQLRVCAFERMDPPGIHFRRELLRAFGERFGLTLPDPVVHWLAEFITMNVRDLESACRKLRDASHKLQVPPSMHLAQQVFQLMTNQELNVVDPQVVLTVVAAYFGLDAQSLCSGKRKHRVSLARSVACYLMRTRSHLSFPAMGEIFDGRNHTTVLSAYRRIEQAVKFNDFLFWFDGHEDRSLPAKDLIGTLNERISKVR